MYYSVPISKNLTLFYTRSKKLLFNISKKRLDSLISKYVDNKLSIDHKFFSIFKSSLFQNDKERKIRLKMRKNICLILDKRIDLSESISKDFNIIRLRDYLLQKKDTRNQKNRRDNNVNVIVGLIFDDRLLNVIEMHRERLSNMLCILIGLQDFYIFRISNSICLKCLSTRRLANLPNMMENILVEKYLNKLKKWLSIDEHILALSKIPHFDRKIDDHIYVYRFDKNKFYKTKLIIFPLCPMRNVKSYTKGYFRKFSADENLGILKPIFTYTKKVGNLSVYISSSYLSRIVPILHFGIYNKNISFSKVQNFFKIKKNLSEFSIYRSMVCGGVSISNRKTAEIKAFGESLERYCAAFFNKKKLVKKSFDSFKKREAIGPNDWVLYADSQYDSFRFPFKKFQNNSIIYWSKGVSLLKNKVKYVPSSFVYVRYPMTKSDIGIYPTTGLACGTNLNQIRIDGICENIERDVCMLTWLLRIPPKIIENIDNKMIKNILRNFADEGITIHLFELSLDIQLPVILAIGISNKKTHPKILIGSACKIRKDDAIIKAIEELAQGFSWIYLMNKYKNYNFGKNFGNITHFEHHILFYATLSDLSILDFILKTKRRINYKDITGETKQNHIFRVLQNKSYDVIEVDLTTPDVFRGGYYVKKIMVPGLQPLNSNHNLSFLDRKRIDRIIEYLRKNKIKYNNSLNPFPHPFP